MALRDLIASAASVNEEVIEEIVKTYVRYDPQASEIVLTHNGAKLSNHQKVLAFLTANEGWIYVDKGRAVSPIRPKEMEAPLGMKGGSLRPCLGRLLKDNLIKREGSGYRIVPANLPKIRSEVLG